MSNEIIEVQNHPQLEPLKEEKPSQEELEKDLSFAREKQLNLIETGEDSLDLLTRVATQLQHPRAFEVLATYLKTMSELNKDLINISERKSYLKNEEKEKTVIPQVTNQMNFVGSTADVAKFLKGILNKPEEPKEVIEITEDE